MFENGKPNIVLKTVKEFNIKRTPIIILIKKVKWLYLSCLIKQFLLSTYTLDMGRDSKNPVFQFVPISNTHCQNLELLEISNCQNLVVLVLELMSIILFVWYWQEIKSPQIKIKSLKKQKHGYLIQANLFKLYKEGNLKYLYNFSPPMIKK